ncbi:hypothetical protein FNV43_RR09506 [Rhamnella rubrinervis]|uniref:Hydroxyproline-rich glycoprotein family protein n=1 Tax=Rhamnella rubrinervis TaxID=2594499 RepID=A0A8K0MKA2_9ROSA|nr:hypothetical protein FNV43_RR09506 [Rhamnella rubrinervis]
MRGSIGIGRKLPNPSNISNAAKQTLIPFSTSSGSGGGGGGGGRGRGRGGSPPTGPTRFVQPVSEHSTPNSSDSPFPSGLGHGRGKPIPSSPVLPSFPSFASRIQPPSAAAGRGRVLSQPGAADPHPPQVRDSGPKRPNFFKREDGPDTAPSKSNIGVSDSGESNLPESVRSSFGLGRGKLMKQPVPETEVKQQQGNRHIRAPAPTKRETETRPKMSREEAVKHAVGVLSRGGDVRENDGGGRGRGMRGRGRGRGGGGGRGRGRWGDRGKRDQLEDSEDGYGAGLYLGDNADGQKLAEKLGPETMNKLVEAFEEMSDRVLPSPMDDAYLDALHTNLMIELEPEYMMGDFERNPDIDEKPPIPLRDALEKMKPFLMAYEGIQSQEEWEEIMKETMETVPLLKEIVDYYSGPDTVTAKEQQQELKRVAKTLPASAPDSVMRFTERAVHSLQSNPGWGFDKKCQFMDKLVRQVSQQYK